MHMLQYGFPQNTANLLDYILFFWKTRPWWINSPGSSYLPLKASIFSLKLGYIVFHIIVNIKCEYITKEQVLFTYFKDRVLNAVHASLKHMQIVRTIIVWFHSQHKMCRVFFFFWLKIYHTLLCICNSTIKLLSQGKKLLINTATIY